MNASAASELMRVEAKRREDTRSRSSKWALRNFFLFDLDLLLLLPSVFHPSSPRSSSLPVYDDLLKVSSCSLYLPVFYRTLLYPFSTVGAQEKEEEEKEEEETEEVVFSSLHSTSISRRKDTYRRERKKPSLLLLLRHLRLGESREAG